MPDQLYTAYLNSSVGFLKVTTDLKAVHEISFVSNMCENPLNIPTVLNDAITQLHEYFSGIRREFNIALNPSGTSFQHEIWEIVSQIEYGNTKSYQEIARISGDTSRTRAVGLANGKNPIPIIIPCHRVIGSNGKLTGYSGGLERKKILLKHELRNKIPKNTLF